MTLTPPMFIHKKCVVHSSNKYGRTALAKAVSQSLLGLDDATTRRDIQYDILKEDEKSELKVLLELATSRGTQDVVFVAVDFENITNITNAFSYSNEGPSHTRNCRFGVSVLDTRDIFNKTPEDMLSTQNFATGSLLSCTKALKRFIYGTSETISIYDLTSKVEEALVRRDNRIEGKYRDVVMVCHGSMEDVRAINSLLISADAKPLRGVLNITRIAHDVFDAGRHEIDSWCLGELLGELGIPVNDPVLPDEPRFLLHVAGNKANFILRALLMMAVKGYQRCTSSDDESASVASILTEVANAPFPVRRSAAELDALLALHPKEPLDDPTVPVDTSRFREKVLRQSK